MNPSRLLAFLVVGIALVATTACSSSPSATSTAGPSPTAQASGPTVSPRSYFPTPPPGLAFTATLVTDTAHLGDHSYNDEAWHGLRQAKTAFGITPAVVQSKSATDYLPELTSAAQHYSTLTVAIGYGMARALYAAADQFPKARFAIVDGRPLDPSQHEVSLPNVENLLFKEQEAGYLVGVLAGLMEKDKVGKATHDTIAYLGGQDIPPVDHYLAGYVAGAKSVDPTVKIIGDFAGTFTDPTTGASLAGQQIAHGADILFQVAGETGTGYLRAAGSHGLYGIGSDSNQSGLGPYILTSAVKRVRVAVRIAVADTRALRFVGGDHLYGATEGAIGLSPPAAVVPASIVAQVKAAQRQIAAGKIAPPLTVPAH